ncbi:MAG: hypothetical protein GXO43_09515 [Crenarchaeota archaeon]|nr:hypothetical protein [Thermoproteota archaeon]
MLRYIGLILVILAIIGMASITVAVLQKPSVSLYSQQGLYTASTFATNIGDKTYLVLISNDIKSIVSSYKANPYSIKTIIEGMPRMLNTPIDVEYMVIGTYMPVPKITGAVSSSTMSRFLQTIKNNVIFEEKATVPKTIYISINENEMNRYKYVYVVLVYITRRSEPISNFYFVPSTGNITTIGDTVNAALNGIWGASSYLDQVFTRLRLDYFGPLWLNVLGYLIVDALTVMRSLLIAAIGIVLIMIDYKRDPEAVRELFGISSRRKTT